jgi:inositol-pentakisphosphate 2-kinase
VQKQALEAWSQESLSLPANTPLVSIKSKFIKSLLPYILHTPLLNHISKLQCALDSLDCEGFAKLAKAEYIQSAGLVDGKNVVFSSNDFTQPTMKDWEWFVDRFLSPDHQKYSSFCPSNLHYHQLAYILSATFKDCSLIIPLDPSEENPKLESIRVIDLDIKGVNRISGWLALDKVIVKEYAKLEIRMRKRCIEEKLEYYGSTSDKFIKAD